MEETHDLDILQLSMRVYNALSRAGYDTIESVQDAREAGKLCRARGIGEQALSEITYALEEWDKAVANDV